VVKYHGLARCYLLRLGFLMRPLLNGGTLGGRRLVTRCGPDPDMFPKFGRLPSEHDGETAIPWSKIEARFVSLAESNLAFAPIAGLARHLARSDFARAGLCGATSMHDLALGPSAYVFQNPHLRIEYDFDEKTFLMVYVDGSLKPWELTVSRDAIAEAVDRFLTKRARWYHSAQTGSTER
jgi:hypothetical protein